MKTRDVLAALGRAVSQLTSLPLGLAEHTTEVSQLLIEAWPAAMLSVCQMTANGQANLAVLGRDGVVNLDWHHRLGGDASSGLRNWRELLANSGQRFAVCRIDQDGEPGGALALLLPRDASEDEEALAQLYLDQLALVLGREFARAARNEDIACLEQLACVGELAGPLAHEFNNFLNILLLQVSVMERLLPAGEWADLQEIRRQGARAIDLVRRFHQYRSGSTPSAGKVDLDRLVGGVVAELDDECKSAGITVQTRGGGVSVRGVRLDLRRLVRFLLRNAIRLAAGSGKEMSIETVQGEGVRLQLEASGPLMSTEETLQLFEASCPPNGVDPFELAACRSMARRARARLDANPRQGGGICMRLTFPSG